MQNVYMFVLAADGCSLSRYSRTAPSLEVKPRIMQAFCHWSRLICALCPLAGSSGPLTAGLKLPKESFSVKMASSTMGKGSNAYSTPPGTPPKPANSSATSAGGATAVAASSSASHAPRHAPAGLLADDGTALVTASSRQHQAQQNRGAVQQSHAEQAHAAALSGRPSTGGGQAVATAAMYASLEHLSAGDDAGFSVSGASHHGAGNGGQLSESQSMSITLCLPQRPLHLHASATESTVPKPNSHAQQAVTDITHGSPADTLGSGARQSRALPGKCVKLCLTSCVRCP